MRRREFIAAVGAGCLSAPHAVRAQQPTTRTIGKLKSQIGRTPARKKTFWWHSASSRAAAARLQAAQVLAWRSRN